MAATSYAPSAKTIATCTHPVDGDPINNDNLYLEAAPGGTPKLTLAYLADCLMGLRAHTWACVPMFVEDVGGTPGTAFGVAACAANTIAAQVFEPPHGGTMTKVTIYVNPVNASPPAGTKVVGKIYKRALSSGTETQLGVTTTDPTTGTDYGANHSFDITCSELIDRTANVYYVSLTGETGAGAATVQWNGTTYTTT